MKYLSILLLAISATLFAQTTEDAFSESTFAGLEFRNIGPAFTSGRIADIAIHPGDESIWYVAVGSGGVWKTENAGVTWTPVFDQQASYSIGCVTIDPNNPHTVWVGTGENVGGRHVGYGDGIYRSLDGGKSWTNMGLKESEHISKIIVHPDNSQVVYAAAQGPLWKQGGERGLYRTLDGGKTWNKVLGGNEWTGVTDVVMDPENPDWLYAATWQRHRNVASYIGGGPGSGIHRSTDGGSTWTKMTSGIPGSNLGKIGLAISPFDSDVIYAAIELDRTTGGVFMSENRGMSWKKQSDAVAGATGPHYYQELYASPHQEGRIYLVDVRIQVSDDHGKTFRRLKEERKHSDSHSINFLKSDPDYLLVGTDGGIYESFDLAETWRFVTNLPVTQYYKVAVDDAEPFYNIYGGTQDNGSHGGPSRTAFQHGIRNADWYFILGGDGHQPATEPGNPDIVYAESQQGVMYRTDRSTGEVVYIQPQAGSGEPFERFNWDTPILVSPHNPARIYTGSYRVWRSENRGDSWTAISGDLTRNQERMELPIMGKVQSWDNAWDLNAMSTYNTITSLAESPVQQGLLYAGTDDGLIQVSENGGESWERVELASIRGVPSTAFVNDLRADLYDARTVYAALDNHKFGDFSPYLIKSTDAGKSWKSIAGNLPDRTLIWRLVQDHANKDLLFAATEFGIYFTLDGGSKWIKLKGGVPTISFRDITIQRREDDLVAASFGRGFFILDDMSLLRNINPQLLQQDAVLFPVKDPWLYVPRSVTGGSTGAQEYMAENPPYGAVFTYYLKEDLKSLKSQRIEAEKALEGDASVPFPGWENLDAEKAEEAPYLLFTITDSEGKIVNHVKAPATKGMHRVSWNLRHASKNFIGLQEPKGSPEPASGFRAMPGEYQVSMHAVQKGMVSALAEPQTFTVIQLKRGSLEPASYAEIDQFRLELETFGQELGKLNHDLQQASKKVAALKQACLSLDQDMPELLQRIYALDALFRKLDVRANGHPSKNEVGEKQSPTPSSRYYTATRGLNSLYGPTGMHRQSLELGKQELEPIKAYLERLTIEVIPQLEDELREAGAPLIEGQSL
jgi:photosystem II stability/assembly factor-like uncharacterized protein